MSLNFRLISRLEIVWINGTYSEGGGVHVLLCITAEVLATDPPPSPWLLVGDQLFLQVSCLPCESVGSLCWGFGCLLPSKIRRKTELECRDGPFPSRGATLSPAIREELGLAAWEHFLHLPGVPGSWMAYKRVSMNNRLSLPYGPLLAQLIFRAASGLLSFPTAGCSLWKVE